LRNESPRCSNPSRLKLSWQFAVVIASSIYTLNYNPPYVREILCVEISDPEV
jgi:hypothetical protein